MKLPVVLTLCFFQIALAQNLQLFVTGTVVDGSTGRRMANVTVYFPGTENGTTTDANGEFKIAIPHDPHTLVARMMGYQDVKYAIASTESCQLRIKMMPSLMELESVIVTATREQARIWDIPAVASVISAADLQVHNPITLGEALQKLTSTSIMSYGGYGAMESLSLQGSSYQQVLVLWDGQRLNSPLSGGCDISTVSLQSLEKIEVVHGSYSSLYGADAMGGVINLVTQNPLINGRVKGTIHSTLGSYGLQKHEATVQHRLGPWSYLFNANLTKNRNDFQFTPAQGVKTLRRTNSALDARTVYGKVMYDQDSRIKLMLSSELSDIERGVPGSLSYPTVDGYQRDETRRYHMDVTGSPDTHMTWHFASFVHTSSIRFTDKNPVFPVHSRNDATSVGANFQGDFKAMGQTLITGGSWMREEGKGSDVGKRQRINTAIFSNANLEINQSGSGIRVVLTPSLRYDHFSDFGEQFNSRAGILVSSKGPSLVGLRMSWGRSFRAPTFNDLYWPEDMFTSGNAGLRPEHALSYDVGIRSRLPLSGGLEFDAGYFNKHATDLILWNASATTGKWMPDNVSSADISGVEMTMAWHGFSGILSTEWSYTHMNALNKSDLPGVTGKRIPYRPVDSGNIVGSLNIQKAFMSLSANYVGQRFIDESNQKKLPPYVLMDATIGIKPAFAGIQFDLALSVKNIFNKEYIVVQDYPMPGRLWQIKCGMNI
jgi:vitamin B12 transporter